MITLGAVHNFHHYHEHTKSTLFTTPSPAQSVHPVWKMMTGGRCLHDLHFSILKKRTLGVNPLPPAYGLYARDNDENYERPLREHLVSSSRERCLAWYKYLRFYQNLFVTHTKYKIGLQHASLYQAICIRNSSFFSFSFKVSEVFYIRMYETTLC